ncbi:hypothetical protein B0H14DRAFT_2825313 [Mycena olivaceomarginata]|nr:hypothetical protein B0H14DRAFT_2825313 [Mycena olivaceomarginata]
MLLGALSVLFHVLCIYVDVMSAATCGCSPLFVPVHVDVLVPKDPMDVFAGLKSNSSNLRRVDDTYDIYGVFCRPDTMPPKKAANIGSPPVEEFRNYSYAAFACDHGLSTLAIDWPGVGVGSSLLNFGAIVEGAHFPFDGLILTGSLSVMVPPPSIVRLSARDGRPTPLGALDPGYITTTSDQDQINCARTGRCVDIAALTAAEQSFEVVLAQGSGHDLKS